MKHNYSVFKRLITVIVVLLAFTFTNIALAQNKQAPDAEPQSMYVSMITVKPGMELEWENFIKKDLIPILKKGGIDGMMALVTDVFGKGSTYMFVIPIQDMAMFDDPDPIAKAAGPDGLALMLSIMQRTVASTHTFLLTGMPDLNIPPKQGYQIKMGVMATMSVAPGRTDDFIKNAKELLAVIKKTNAKAVLTASVGLGGNPNDFIMFVVFDSFKDLGQFPKSFEKAMANTKLTPQTGVTTHVEYTVLKAAPELGIQPKGQ